MKIKITILLTCLLSFMIKPRATAADTLKIMSWNVYLIPKIYVRKHNSKRAAEIGHTLKHSEKDIIVLQELFGKRMFNVINDSIKDVYPYRYGPGKTGFYKLNSGVIIYSKYPLENTKIIKYNHAGSVDRMANKSAVTALVNINGFKVQVIGTHLQSRSGHKFSRIRFKQLETILSDSAILSNKEYPKLYVGDLNVNLYGNDHSKLLKMLNAKDGPLCGDLRYSSDPCNTMKGDDHMSTLDYILLDKNGKNIEVLNRSVTQCKGMVCIKGT